MENYKRIAEIMATTPDGLDKIREILKSEDISVIDEGMRIVVIEKDEKGDN